MSMTKEEQRAYQRGYQAGIRRLKREHAAAKAAAEERAFRDRAFLAALPACINAQGWQTGDGKQITTLPQRTSLAWSFAKESVKQRRSQP